MMEKTRIEEPIIDTNAVEIFNNTLFTIDTMYQLPSLFYSILTSLNNG
jgi:hypothetical protein